MFREELYVVQSVKSLEDPIADMRYVAELLLVARSSRMLTNRHMVVRSMKGAMDPQ